VCETLEYGRQYIDLTRRYADLFHARRRIAEPEPKPSPRVVSVSARGPDGIRLIPQPAGDGPVALRHVAGRLAIGTAPNRHSGEHRYLYFDVDDLFARDTDESFLVTIGYFDEGAARFAVEYDSADPAVSGIAQRFRPAAEWRIGGTGTWKQVTVTLHRARFAGRANGADFRLVASGGDLAVGHIAMRRPTSSAK
jgi:hypothetical protein